MKILLCGHVCSPCWPLLGLNFHAEFGSFCADQVSAWALVDGELDAQDFTSIAIVEAVEPRSPQWHCLWGLGRATPHIRALCWNLVHSARAEFSTISRPQQGPAGTLTMVTSNHCPSMPHCGRGGCAMQGYQVLRGECCSGGQQGGVYVAEGVSPPSTETQPCVVA
jgi:hypothetical protein